jgi:DNA helicase HerA-like ATPase
VSRLSSTYIGTVRGLTGAVASIELRPDLTSTLTMVRGETHRVGQIGSFIRIPLGYSNLYGVVTQVGVTAAPGNLPGVTSNADGAQRWLSVALFGEAVSDTFERGVSQYPTVGDEAHVVTTTDLEVIYRSAAGTASVELGTISSSSGIPARLDLASMISRHVAVVGSTGSGKSNLVAVLLEAIATSGYPSARVFVLDAHGEYGTAIGNTGYVFKIRPTLAAERSLRVPFWALPADEFIAIAMGRLSPPQEAAVRDAIADLKRSASALLPTPPPPAVITADSPVPFNARRLWFELDDHERVTIQDRENVIPATRLAAGDAALLRSNIYPPPGPGNRPPFVAPRHGISRQLELMRSRLLDARLGFLFSPGDNLTPDLDGRVARDLDSVVASWVGHDRPITVLDISGLPAEVMASIAGTVLRIIYDTLFWAAATPVSGRAQPLLVVVEEAHRILPAGIDSPATRTTTQIAKEGRKHGVGLMIVTQRPTEIEPSILSQCGTMISMRLSNHADRAIVAGTMPDDLGNLAAVLPALRTGEALATGEALRIPTRMRFRLASSKPRGDEPRLAEAWRRAVRPDPACYTTAMTNWRRQHD